MDIGFAIYEARRQLWNLAVTDWINDLTSYHYWGIVTFILLYYAVWWKFTDKRRISDLLLYGSFIATIRSIFDLLGVNSGLWYYNIHIIPVPTSIFLHNLTIIPLTFMLIEQYSSTWKQFFIESALGSAFIAGVIFPIESWLGLIVFMKWNYIYSFVAIYLTAIFSRSVFFTVKRIQNGAIEESKAPFLLQPAFKPTNEKDDEEEQ